MVNITFGNANKVALSHTIEREGSTLLLHQTLSGKTARLHLMFKGKEKVKEKYHMNRNDMQMNGPVSE